MPGTLREDLCTFNGSVLLNFHLNEKCFGYRF